MFLCKTNWFFRSVFIGRSVRLTREYKATSLRTSHERAFHAMVGGTGFAGDAALLIMIHLRLEDIALAMG